MINNLIKYGFSLGRVYILEQSLLSQNDYERLLEARSFKEKVHILSETIFSPYIEQVKDEQSIEQGLAQYLNTLYTLVDELIENEAASEYFRQARGLAIKAEEEYFQRRLSLAKKSSIDLLVKLTELEIDFAQLKRQLREGSVDQRSAPQLDKDLDDNQIRLINQYKHDPITSNRIIAFLKAKEFEIKNVRHILFGGLNNIAEETIAENLRYQYA